MQPGNDWGQAGAAQIIPELDEDAMLPEDELLDPKQNPLLILPRAPFKQRGSELLLVDEHNFMSLASSHLNVPFRQAALPSVQNGISLEFVFPHLVTVIFPIAEFIQRGSESLLFEVQSLIAPASQAGVRFGLKHLVIPSSQMALFGEVTENEKF